MIVGNALAFYKIRVDYDISREKQLKFLLTKMLLWTFFKLFLLILASEVACNSADEVYDTIGKIERIYNLKPCSPLNQKEILFYFLRKDLGYPILLTKQTKEQLDRKKPTKVFIHGWLGNLDSVWYSDTAERFLRVSDCNIIMVDWEKFARSLYVDCAVNSKAVGDIIGNFIIDLNLHFKTLHIIGHSIGAHIAGFAGKLIHKRVGFRIFRITGMDPAAPHYQYYFQTSFDRLHHKDATIVDVIHTDGGSFGFFQPLGTLDLYINGGRGPQPGCRDSFFNLTSSREFVEQSVCSHVFSYSFFMHSLGNKIECYKCTWKEIKYGNCSFREAYIIINQKVDFAMKGICYLKTSEALGKIPSCFQFF